MLKVDDQRVKELMTEYDLDATKFFARYGGGPSVVYHVLHPDLPERRYPPAAIAQAALGWKDINGGRSKPNSACNVLERSGFKIIEDDPLKAASIKAFQARIAAITEIERLQIVAIRIGQTIFRKALLQRSGGKCEVTCLSDDILLRASHIKPWSECTGNDERLDPENGIMLSALWDAAFDKGLVSFDEMGAAIYSSSLSLSGRASLSDGLKTNISLSDKRAEYLTWHRQHMFKG